MGKELTELHWVKCHRVKQTNQTRKSVTSLSQKRVSGFRFINGSVTVPTVVYARRLTRKQVERSLHEILGIDIPLAEKLPDEGRPRGFTTVAEYQTMSHHHLARHLAVVDEALDEASRRALNPTEECHRDLEPRAIARSNPRRRCREPEMLRGQAVVWSSTMAYYGRIPATTRQTMVGINFVFPALEKCP